jgi:hypothetical protein
LKVRQLCPYLTLSLSIQPDLCPHLCRCPPPRPWDPVGLNNNIFLRKVPWELIMALVVYDFMQMAHFLFFLSV